MSRTRNSRRNIAVGLVRSAVTLLVSFVTRTILIRTFGVEYAGLGGLFASVLQVLSLADLGLGTAMVYALYQPVATGDDKTVCAYLSFFRRAYRIIGSVMLVAGVALVPVLPNLVAGGRLPDGLSLNACWAIFLLDAVPGYLTCGYLACIPTAAQRGDILSTIDIGIALVRCAMQVAMLRLGMFYGYLIVMPVMTVSWNLVVWLRVRRDYPQYVCEGTLDPKRTRELRRNVYGLFLRSVLAVMRNGIDIMCISAFAGLALAGVYGNYLVVLNGLVAVTSVLLTAITPSVGNSVVTESVDKNHADLRRFDFIYTGVAGWVTACLLCLWQPFMTLWVGEDLLLGWPEMCGLALYYYLLKSGDLWSVYGEALGLWWSMRRVSVAEALANVVLNIVLCRWLGVAGVILASIVTVALLSFVPCPRILWREYFGDRDVREFFAAHGLWALSALPGTAACLATCAICPEGLAGLALRTVVCMGVYPAIWWLLWGRSAPFGDVVAWVRGSGLLRRGA